MKMCFLSMTTATLVAAVVEPQAEIHRAIGAYVEVRV
jgi:hypothetical protein